jgi:hypothetical protein
MKDKALTGLCWVAVFIVLVILWLLFDTSD